jgi:hypothetical protein
VSIGRQLFVDSFLVDPNGSQRLGTTYYQPIYRDDVNPVLRDTQKWEQGFDTSGARVPALDFATPYSGGLFWDPAAQLYKFWYSCGSPKALASGVTCLATSPDGIKWDKDTYDVVPGTNIVYNHHFDGNVVWLDLDEPRPGARYKQAAVLESNKFRCYTISESSDGVHWNTTNPCTGPIEDRSSIFLNPLRSPRQWVYSIKSAPKADVTGPYGRSRSYWESDELGVGADWSSHSFSAQAQDRAHDNHRPAYNWTSADRFDPPWSCGSGTFTQLYNLDAVAYESVIVGLFSILTGKRCKDGRNHSDAESRPVYNRTWEWDSVFTGYSRDGFHWFRPVDLKTGRHRVFLPQDTSKVVCNKTGGACNWKWNKANVQSVGGGFVVQNGGPLRFYVGARTGTDQLVGNGTAGFAELRRDGFASVGPSAGAPTAVLRTRPLTFGGKGREPLLFINAVAANHITIAVLDASNLQPLPGLNHSDYAGGARGVTDSDRLQVGWESHVGPSQTPLTKASGQRIVLEVHFGSPAAQLYSFWFATDACGASHGFLAAGGAGFNASSDTVGSCGPAYPNLTEHTR